MVHVQRTVESMQVHYNGPILTRATYVAIMKEALLNFEAIFLVFFYLIYIKKVLECWQQKLGIHVKSLIED